jgi:hypothetical protein
VAEPHHGPAAYEFPGPHQVQMPGSSLPPRSMCNNEFWFGERLGNQMGAASGPRTCGWQKLPGMIPQQRK